MRCAFSLSAFTCTSCIGKVFVKPSDKCHVSLSNICPLFSYLLYANFDWAIFTAAMFQRRIFPEDVILNLAEDAPVPKAVDMPGHCWKDIAHDSTVTWLAFYRDSINDQVGALL